MKAGAVQPARGAELRCQGWRQEGILRMLENTVANGERPDELVIYGGIGKAARDWPSYHAIVAALRDLADDETLVVQSGRPVAVFRSFPDSPRVVLANANLVPRAATTQRFGELSAAGLTMHGQYTAGSWAYIGGQGIVQGSFETFGACAGSFGGTLSGRVVLTAGLGGMGSAQGPAIAMNQGVALVCEVDETKIANRLADGRVDEIAKDVPDAWRRCRKAADGRQPLVVAVAANAADVAEELVSRGMLPDVATDQTSAHDLLTGYVPAGYSLVEATRLREAHPDEYRRAAGTTVARHVRALLAMRNGGTTVFEYGNDLRGAGKLAGVAEAFDIPGFVASYVRPSFAVGRGPYRWVCLSGEESDRVAIDTTARTLFPEDDRLQQWLGHAERWTATEGLPARICWLGHGARALMAREINRKVREGELAAPVAITRDHLDSGSCSYPGRETENMPDGSDEIADWPYLNAMLNVAGGADLVAIHQNAGIIGGSCSAGMTLVCDGSELADERIDRCFASDPGIGVVRHATAGVPEAVAYLPHSGIHAIHNQASDQQSRSDKD
ncbi:urocanate hydratase [Tamaricihabitans halophyticus]|uniref:Urocanate hydratase n=1 Tax=Tamaricihabitans halophyticus TaxID=1262583 RepID=A0A4R2Q427_9PSEU|nr:urocanate hydratase [Tamaricihabitans halophyticus]TCP42624.1 urocanate hydratase [Tamaricihabitans halophyticus]